MAMEITLQDFGKETLPNLFYTKTHFTSLSYNWFTIDAAGSNGL
jgi:hypothetical protein